MKRRRVWLLTGVMGLALCAACGVWLHIQRVHYARNRLLIAVVAQGDSNAALALVNEGADPDTRLDPTPVPSLMGLLRQLLRHDPTPNNFNQTTFQYAANRRWSLPVTGPNRVSATGENFPLLQAMLAHGAHVDARTFGNSTALHFAVTMGRIQSAEWLLNHGANINARDESGRTPLMMAMWNGTTNMAHLLLNHGANPNIQDVEGRTALHWTVQWDRTEQFSRELLAHQANPNIPDNKGVTPLQEAQRMRRVELAALMRR